MKILFTLFILLNAHAAFSQTDAADEKAIQATVRNLNEIWNRHDMDAYCDLFTEDATWVNVLGMFWQNRADLCTAHKVIKEVFLKYWTAEMNLVKIKFPSHDVALVYITETNTVQQSFDAGPKKYLRGDVFHDQLFLVYTRRNNEWKITAGQNTSVDEGMAQNNPIKSK